MNAPQPLRTLVRADLSVDAVLNYPVISLFSGAMGLDLGLERAGLHIAMAQELDRAAADTIRLNGYPVEGGDIRNLLANDPDCSQWLAKTYVQKQQVFAVVGGPPCQAFSTAGKRLGTSDARGQLYEQFMQVVSAVRPRFFVMENVKGLASMPSEADDAASLPLLEKILSAFSRMGYHTVHGVLDAVHYGTPQFRERLVIVGSRDNEDIYLPIPSHFPRHQNPSLRWRTFNDAMQGLKNPGEHSRFSSSVQAVLAMVPEGGNWKSLAVDVAQQAMGGAYHSGGGKVGFFRRLNGQEPSPTLVTSPTQKATMLCHPTQLRPLSVREYARLQGFPDDWRFSGSLSDKYRQIGNAVPLPLGEAIGQMLISVAQGDAEIKVKRMRGTSVHRGMLGNQELKFD